MSQLTLPIEIAAREHADQIAFYDGNLSVTYAELEEAFSADAGRFERIIEGTRVAWKADNKFDDMLVFWGLLKRRAIACPISKRIPDERVRQVLSQIDAIDLSAVPAKANFGFVRNSDYLDDSTSEKPATIILSSGSTGEPKAIVHTVAAHVANARGAADNMPLEPGDRWLWSLPLYHISGMSILFRCAIAGASVIGLPDDCKVSAAVLSRLEVTHLSVVSTQLRVLMEEDNFPAPSLKYVLLGGSSVDTQLVEAARKRGVNVLTTYGLTEMASQVTTSTVNGDPATSGHLLPFRQLKIGPDSEILVRGEPLCLGYFRDGKIDPVVDDDGWFHTKDLGMLSDDGQLIVTGRLDNMFISGGENIHPENIEQAMMKQFDIDEVLVVPRSDPTYGMRPVAFVRGVLPADWDLVLRQHLKSFEIPVEIHDLPEPTDGSIKAKRSELKRLVAFEHPNQQSDD